MARKDKSAIVSGAGWIGSLADKLVRTAREHGVSDEKVHSLATDDGEAVINAMVDAAVVVWACGASKVIGTFQITLAGDATASELVLRGQYDWHNNWITDERFPIQSHEPIPRTIELVEFDHDPTSEEVLADFARRGLERPTHEDALCFGIQHPEEQRKHPIVFLHEPVLSPGVVRDVLVLRGIVGDRELHLCLFGGWWSSLFVFAGVRKPA